MSTHGRKGPECPACDSSATIIQASGKIRCSACGHYWQQKHSKAGSGVIPKRTYRQQLAFEALGLVDKE